MSIAHPYRVAEGPVKRIHWIPLSLCWAARGVRHWSWVIRWVASWGLPRQPPACLPGAKITDTHIHTYKEYAHRYSQTTQYMHREEDSRHIGDFFRSCLVGFYPENQNPKFQSGRHWTKLTHACIDQKIMNQPQNLMAFSPINVKRDQSILNGNLKHNLIVISKTGIEGQLFLKIIICVYTQKEEPGLVRYSYSQRWRRD